MIKAIFRDNDGVLVDTERLYFLATQQVMARAGVALTQEQYVEMFMVQGAGAWHLVVAQGYSDADVEALRDIRNARYSDMLDQETLVIDGVHDVLRALHGSYAMGIVTSSRTDHFERIHRTTNLLPYFQFVLTRSDYIASKPHPEPYLLAIERSGCHKDECLVIEDSERGLASATAAGLKCIVVPNALTKSGSFANAYKVLGNVTELITELR